MNPIQVLLPQVANQIAAGEVVERPASIVKELVENSIDAGATLINIDIGDGGKELIRIRDNGSGIPKDQLDLALAPHATSKLRAIDDLDNLVSYGFRGEALASISSVSKLTLTSRTAQDVAGWQIYNEGKEYRTKSEPVAHNKGTTINVAELFYNTPARKKFLKSATVEFNYIEDLVRRMAIVRPNVEWTLSHNGKQKFRFKGLEPTQFRERIQQVHPRSFTEDTISIKAQTKTFDMQMELVIEPFNGMNTKTNCVQYCYINNRMIKDKVLISAMKQALSELFNFVNYNYVLFLTIDPHAVDINVHPAKAEVRFIDAHKVHSFIFQNVFLQLSRQNGINEQFVDNILIRTNLDTGLIDQQALDAFTAQQRLPVPASRLASKSSSADSKQIISSVHSETFNLRSSLAQAQKSPNARTFIQPQESHTLTTPNVNSNLNFNSNPESESSELDGIKSYTDPSLQQAAEQGELPSFQAQPRAKNYSANNFSFSSQPSYNERTGNLQNTIKTSDSFGFGTANSQWSNKSFNSTNSGTNFNHHAQPKSSSAELTSLLGNDFLAQARTDYTTSTTNTSTKLLQDNTQEDALTSEAQHFSTSLANFNQEFSAFVLDPSNQDLNLQTIACQAPKNTQSPQDLSDEALLDSVLEADQAKQQLEANSILSTHSPTDSNLTSITVIEKDITQSTQSLPESSFATVSSSHDSPTNTQLSRAFIARDYLSHYLDLRQQQEFLFFLNQTLPSTLHTAIQVQGQFAQPRLETQVMQRLEQSLDLAQLPESETVHLVSPTLAPLEPLPAPSQAQLRQIIQTPTLATQALENGNARSEVPQELLDFNAVCNFSLAAFQREVLSCVTQGEAVRSQLLTAHTNTLAGLYTREIAVNPSCSWLDATQEQPLRVLSVINSICLLQQGQHAFIVSQYDLLELMQTVVHQQLETVQASFAQLQLEATQEGTHISKAELERAQLLLNNLEILDLWCNSDLKKFAIPEVYAYNLEVFTRLGLFRHGAYLSDMLSTKVQPIL